MKQRFSPKAPCAPKPFAPAAPPRTGNPETGAEGLRGDAPSRRPRTGVAGPGGARGGPRKRTASAAVPRRPRSEAPAEERGQPVARLAGEPRAPRVWQTRREVREDARRYAPLGPPVLLLLVFHRFSAGCRDREASSPPLGASRGGGPRSPGTVGEGIEQHQAAGC